MAAGDTTLILSDASEHASHEYWECTTDGSGDFVIYTLLPR